MPTTPDEPTTGDEPTEQPDELTVVEPGEDPDGDVEELGYEQARDELVQIVARLEGGAAGLEESMRLWERGEKLAARCQSWLDSAEQRLDAASAARAEDDDEGED